MRRLAHILRPLGVPALLALILAAWPIILPLLWLALTGWLLWQVITGMRRPRR